MRPADSLTTVLGIRMRAVATHLAMSRPVGASWSWNGVPLTATSALIGTDSGWAGSVWRERE